MTAQNHSAPSDRRRAPAAPVASFLALWAAWTFIAAIVITGWQAAGLLASVQPARAVEVFRLPDGSLGYGYAPDRRALLTKDVRTRSAQLGFPGCPFLLLSRGSAEWGPGSIPVTAIDRTAFEREAELHDLRAYPAGTTVAQLSARQRAEIRHTIADGSSFAVEWEQRGAVVWAVCLWAGAGLLLAAIAKLLWRVVKKQRLAAGCCSNCGHSHAGISAAATCPECGSEPQA